MVAIEYRVRPGVPGNPIRSDEEATAVAIFFSRELIPDATASEIVAAAKPVESPIHGYFEWRNTEAARLYREEQARLLARSVEVKILDSAGDEVWTRAFEHVNVVVDTSAGMISRSTYAPATTVWESRELADQVTDRMRRELAAMVDRYGRYEHLAGAVEGIARALQEIQ